MKIKALLALPLLLLPLLSWSQVYYMQQHDGQIRVVTPINNFSPTTTNIKMYGTYGIYHHSNVGDDPSLPSTITNVYGPYGYSYSHISVRNPYKAGNPFPLNVYSPYNPYSTHVIPVD